jgi:hypothetical protein
MDKPALFALATATLVQSLNGSYDNDDLDSENGAHPPYDVAFTTLKLWERDEDLKRINRPIDVFKWGFEYGLQLGAAIAEQPGRISNTNEIIKPIMLAIEQSIYEQREKERSAA